MGHRLNEGLAAIERRLLEQRLEIAERIAQYGHGATAERARIRAAGYKLELARLDRAGGGDAVPAQ